MDLTETDDLARHDGLDEAGLNDALKLRFEHDRIYTYVGDILIAVNPYAKLSLYGEADSKRYTNVASKADFPPHLFAIADAAYAEMNRNNKPQVSDCV
jgi:myosin heavy subunit